MDVPGPGLRAPLLFNFASDVMDHWAHVRPDDLALWCVCASSGSGRRLTFRQVAEESLRTAAFLRTSGIRKGDRVLLMLPRISEWWTVMLALTRLGAIPVPATLLLTHRDVEYRVKAADIHAVITTPEGVTRLDGFEGVRFLVGGEAPGWLNLQKGIASSSANIRLEPTRSDDPGILYFTSATTGDPKMVLHTQASYGFAHRLTGHYWLDLRPGDLHWNISDLGWGKAAWSSFFGPWSMGACVFALDTHGKFDPSGALDALEHFPITTWCAPPTALRLIVRQDICKRSFPKLRHCVTAGEPLNPEVLNLWQRATGLTLYEAYGQSETVVLIGNYRCLNLPVQAGSMGQPTPGMNVTLVDHDLQEIPPGNEGEIALRLAPERPVGLFKEYWRSEDPGGAHFRGDFYLTGDRAIRDRDGYFWFIGRKDDVIKSSGYRIGPFEVESALIEHSSVLDVAVVGKPDALRGQIVKAYIVLREGCEGSDELKAELQQHCKNLVAAYKYPRDIEFVHELPKTTSGKTRRFELRKAASAQTC